MTVTSYPEIVDRYAIYRPLASGGMATVHLGRLVGPAGFSRTVAIKRMRADFLADPDFMSMFADEARVAGRIRHPNVVAVIDVVATKKELLLVMEYVQGETLGRLMQLATERGDEMPPPVAAAIVRDVLVGLHAAHETKDEQGKPLSIIHRDVSPQNVIVGIDGSARVLDFGIAKAIGRSHVTRDGNVKGKLAYMSPEQLQGIASRATDTFAASVVLWELLTGTRLFRGETDAETVMKVLAAPIPKPSDLRKGLGTAYDDVVLQGLARDSNNAFKTARDMALALAKAVDLPDCAEVGEWVATVARDRLSAQEQVVAEVESGASFPRVRLEAHEPPTSVEPETRFTAATLSRVVAAPQWKWVGLSVLSASMLVAIGIGVTRSRGRESVEGVRIEASRMLAAPTRPAELSEPFALPLAVHPPVAVSADATPTPPAVLPAVIASGYRLTAVASSATSARPAPRGSVPPPPASFHAAPPRIPDHL